ncbi:MAG: gluconokinase [Gemmatimonadaceae bacterium]|nr:gluconokinase [Gemmatimonadaceae bacterium]
MTGRGAPDRPALVLMGTAAAGKTAIGSAVAAALGVRFVEGDDFHPPANVARMAAGIPLTDADREGWLQALAGELRTARLDGRGIVMSCSALRRIYRDVLRGGDDGVQFVFLHAGIDVLRDRLAARRGHFMPVSLLESQFATLEPPAADERAWHLDASRSREELTRAILSRLGASAPEARP